jgi:hypothetical protein
MHDDSRTKQMDSRPFFLDSCGLAAGSDVHSNTYTGIQIMLTYRSYRHSYIQTMHKKKYTLFVHTKYTYIQTDIQNIYTARDWAALAVAKPPEEDVHDSRAQGMKPGPWL